MPKVFIYTIDSCPYCTELKEILTKEGVEFTDINVNLPENEKEYDKRNVFYSIKYIASYWRTYESQMG